MERASVESAAPDWARLNRYARAAGVAMVLTMIFGALGEMVIPNRIIMHGDAAGTAANILAHNTLFRAGFAAYFVEGVCDIALCLFFYVLLEPVNRHVALLSAFFGIASMVTYATSEASYFNSSLMLSEVSGMSAFTVEQRNALAMLSMRVSGAIASLFLALYGIASMIRGYLIMRSRYFPAVLGVLLMIGGLGFMLATTTYVLAPSYRSDLMLLPMAVAGLPLMVWLLVKGVRPRDARTLSSR
jgi:Domain of unknown function (DUF4386)